MPIQLDEKTEITLPLKIVVGLGVALVNETAERVRQMELEMIRQQKDIEYLKEQLKKKSL